VKINQVEELVGITKKNIRFYEAQGLVRPERDPSNGYREYTLRDVEQLQRVKLLRMLDVPCERIRRVTDGELPLPDCMRAHAAALKARQADLARMRELCALLEQADDLASLDTAEYLETMRRLEQGGARFVDVKQSDVKKRRAASILSAAVFVVLMAAIIALALWGNSVAPMPTLLLIFIIVFPLAVIVGVLIALRQRLKELKGGELDEAGQY
jgi:DNA-binding transcriptional MerR regulator